MTLFRQIAENECVNKRNLSKTII